jgi:hypothetical protein
MSESILTSTKKILGIEEDYTAYDFDILTHINSALSTLTQIGVGPEGGFMIVDAEDTWDTFIGTDPKLNPVKQYVFLRVKSVFDPPQSAYAVEAMKEQIKEHEVRLNIQMEHTIWIDPTDSVPTDDEEVVLDGGGA